MIEGLRLIRPLQFGPVSEVWQATLGHRPVIAKRYPTVRIDGPWPPPPDARILTAIAHRHIVRLLASGTDADQALVHVFEALDGETLAACMGRPDACGPDLAIRVLLDAGSALRWLHLRNPLAPRLHGDLSPANVFVCASGRVKLLDVSGQAPGQGEAAEGWVCGTAGFVSPDRARGASLRPCDEVYALGRVLEAIATADVAPWFQMLIAAMTAVDAEARPSIDDVMTFARARARLHPRAATRTPGDESLPTAGDPCSSRGWSRPAGSRRPFVRRTSGTPRRKTPGTPS